MACEFNVPEEWKDEARMHFLVSDFSPSHEPTLSDDRVKFWRALIRSSSQELHKWTFTKRELSQRLAWHQFEPKCLPRLLDVLERAGEIRKLDSYRFDEMGWTEWSLRLMSTPVTWAWKMAWQKSPDQSSQDVVYVLVPAVKELCEIVVSTHHHNVIHISTDCLMTHAQFKDLLRNVTSAGVSDRCLHALELQLLEGQKIKRGHMSADTDEVIVKFATSPSGKATPVSEIDIGILSIMRTITGMQKKIDNGNEEIQKLKGRSIELFDFQALVLMRRMTVISRNLLEEGENISDVVATQFGGLEIDEDDLLRELEELDDVEKVTEKMRSFKIEECKPVTPQKVVHNQADEEKKPKEKLPKAKPISKEYL
uniref:Charged multivesicular body protein 7 n=1 Tax=Amphimedon queenslandica TaxID=400682 RepID=A0A1X7VRH3_AMPQE